MASAEVDYVMVDYVTVGHVTVDVIVDAAGESRRQPGGGAFYSALQAARLGLRTRVLTAGVPAELQALLEPYRDELDVRIAPAPQTTTLATHGSGANRRQRLLAWAGPIPPATLPTRCRLLHLAPVARELTGAYDVEAPFVALTPQGLVRSWQRLGGELGDAPLDAAALPPRCDAIVMSEAERTRCGVLFGTPAADGPAAGRPATDRRDAEQPAADRRASDRPAPGRREDRPIVAVTAGPGPTTLHLPDGSLASVPPPQPATLIDDLGAGDVFAAAFFVALARGEEPVPAAAFGNAAAAARIAGAGPGAIGGEAAIAAVLAAGDSG